MNSDDVKRLIIEILNTLEALDGSQLDKVKFESDMVKGEVERLYGSSIIKQIIEI